MQNKQPTVQSLMEELQTLTEDFTQKPKPGSRPGSLKRKAAQYLGKGAGEKLSKTEFRDLCENLQNGIAISTPVFDGAKEKDITNLLS